MKKNKVLIVSPSATIQDNIEGELLIKKGREMLEKIGLDVNFSKNALGKLGYKSADIKQRVSDIESAYQDPSVTFIMSTQGGDNTNELLPYLNWEVIKNNPKKFIGASDITIFLNSLYVHTGQKSFFGPDLIWGLGKNATDYTMNNIKDLLIDNTIKFTKNPKYSPWKNIRNGEGSGICLGGCINSFVLLLGTENDPIKNIEEPFILILEGIGESIARIESYVTQIVQQPNFSKYCRGIINGYYYRCSEEISENIREISNIIKEQTTQYNFPIIEISELGHAVENIIFPIGGKIRVTSGEEDINISLIDKL